MGASLVPPSSATVVATQSGSWQDASTWDGRIPGAGDRVFIPAGITVTNHATTADVLWIHVAGTLTCCDHCDTQINVHTLYVPMGGSVRLGMVGHQVTGRSVIEFVPGPFLPGDITKLSLGLICHGEFMACGLEKTAWDSVDGDLAVGATTLKLRTVPRGWKVGDRILIAGTNRYPVGSGKPDGPQSEFRTITAIAGRDVTFTSPLTFRHFRWKPDVPFHCANLSRNVVIRSRDTSAIANRGHLMFMSSMNDIRYAEIVGLGRTNKQQPVTDPRTDAYGDFVVGSDANPRARYSDHVHRAGPLGGVSRRVGNVVDGSPGWGMVNHASNCEWDDNITIRCVGFGAGTEEGQERGHIRRHLSALNINPTPVSSGGGRESIGDFGINGEGIWLQGGLVEIEDVVCFDNSGVGVHVFNSPLNNHPEYAAVALQPHLQFPIEHAGGLLPPDVYAGQNAPTGRVPVTMIRRLNCYGNLRGGLSVWYGHFNNFTSPTAIRNQIRDVVTWGAANAPQVNLEYGSNTDVTDVRVIGDVGINPSYDSVTRRSYSVFFGRAPNVTVRGLTTEGMQTGAVGLNPTKNHIVED